MLVNRLLSSAQVAVVNGKQEGKGSKKKEGSKASRGSTPATDAATTSGGEEAEDRWDFECIECGEAGDPLLCCEVCRGIIRGRTAVAIELTMMPAESRELPMYREWLPPTHESKCVHTSSPKHDHKKSAIEQCRRVYNQTN